MTPEEIQELKELIGFLRENRIGEFEFERGDRKVRVKFGASDEGTAPPVDWARMMQAFGAAASVPHHNPPPARASAVENSASAAPAAASAAAVTSEEHTADLHVVKSPIVGTFYDSPSPGAAPFVKVGDTVENGQVLCIVEAMKLMNEIESDAGGEVVRRLVSSGQPVEYGQPLFAIRLR